MGGTVASPGRVADLLAPVTVPVRSAGDPARPDRAALEDAADALRRGGLVAFPTETVYGLGAALDRPDALDRVFAAKGRPPTDPLIVHVPDREALEGIVAAFPEDAAALADAFWPGPLTLVLPRGARTPDAVTAGGGAVGVRVPAHEVALGLLRAAGGPVAAPSANRFGRISPTGAGDVVAELGDRLDPELDLVLDGGPTPLGIESTVVDLAGATPRLLRPGGVAVEDVEAVVGPVEVVERRVVAEDEVAPAPGGLLRHYAPGTPLVLVDGDARTVTDLRAAVAARGVDVRALALPPGPDEAATALYRVLRDADGLGADVLVVGVVDPAGIGRAVNDRLFRAAHGRVVTDAGSRSVDRVVGQARA